ncbi:MAG TPA: hypothetical protein VJK09_02135 [Candidatus Paceibacterota bacterium]
MDKIDKALARFNKEDYFIALELMGKICAGNITGLNIRKLSGYTSAYRAKQGKVRVIFEMVPGQMPEIRIVDRRNDNTYKNL